MSLPIRTTGFDTDGILLVSPASEDFDSHVSSLLPRGAPVALEIKPYLVIVSNEIRPGEQRLIGVGFEIWPEEDVEDYRDFDRAMGETRADATALHIEVDAVIFEDGQLLGADRSDLATHFAACVAAKQDVYRGMVERIDNSGVSVDVFAPLRAALSTRPFPSYGDPTGVYPSQAAAEALGLQHNVMRDVFHRALHRDPFIIRRSGPRIEN